MFEEFPKIARLTRECVVTEKIDGTNAQVHIRPVTAEDYEDTSPLAVAHDTKAGLLMFAGSRSRYLTTQPGSKGDNFGFAAWVTAHADELFALGEGRHYGEWWGSGIQRGYGLSKGERRFSLFNVARWADNRDREKYPQDRPVCCHVVPVLYRGAFDTFLIDGLIEHMRLHGSLAAPGFMKPEGIVVWHEAARQLFKKTLEKDEEGKEQRARKLAHTT